MERRTTTTTTASQQGEKETAQQHGSPPQTASRDGKTTGDHVTKESSEDSPPDWGSDPDATEDPVNDADNDAEDTTAQHWPGRPWLAERHNEPRGSHHGDRQQPLKVQNRGGK